MFCGIFGSASGPVPATTKSALIVFSTPVTRCLMLMTQVDVDSSQVIFMASVL
jgi:hypothetical protein